MICILTLFRIGLSGAAHERNGAKRVPSLKSVIHILQWWNLEKSYLTQRISKKYMNYMTHTLSSADIRKNFTGNQQIFLYQEIQIETAFSYIISNSFNFFRVLKIVLIKMVIIFMMSAKMATLDILEIKGFWKKDYDVKIYLHDVINKICHMA